MNRRTLNTYLEDFRARGGETAFAHRRGLRRERWSYARVAGTACAFARELEARGIGRGERVLFWSENSAEWVAAFYGCLLRGVIVVPLDPESALDFVERVGRQTNARLLLRGEDERCRRRTAPGVESLRLAELGEIVARHSSDTYSAVEIEADTTAEIIYTSGTTAEPKGVVLTHANLLANLLPLEREIEKYRKWVRLVHPLRFLNLLPLGHVFGQFMGVFVPPLLGGEVYFQSSLNPSEIAETVRRERVSIVVTVPRVLEVLRDRVERAQSARGRGETFRRALAAAGKWGVARRWWAFRRVRREFGWKFWAFVAGGATLPAATEDFWQRLGYAVVQGYGMTETASLISVNHPFKRSRGSIGKTLPGQEVRLDELSGEIMVRGANVSRGYWSGDVRAAGCDGGDDGGDDGGGWLRTGDLGELDAAGNLFFKGRKKDVIVTAAGVNLHPADLEAALGAQVEVREAVVVGLDLGRGPEPAAALILRQEDDAARGVGAAPSATVAAAAAIARANEALNGSQQIRRWAVWPERDFPRTATQKVRKLVVAERLRAQLAVGAAEAAGAGETSAALAEAIARVGRASRAKGGAGGDANGVAGGAAGDGGAGVGALAQLDRAAALEIDLKLDSLGRVELLSALEDACGVELDESAFTAATTVGDIERMIREGSAGGVVVEVDRVGGSGGGGGGGAGDDDTAAAAAAEYPYPRWARRAPAVWVRRALLYVFVMPLVWWMARPRVTGAEHLKDLRGPVLFVADHVTRADQALVLWALPRRFRHRLAIAMEGELLRDWRRGRAGANWFARASGLAQYALVVAFFNVFPLPKRSGFRRSFAYAGESADGGLSLLVFPEGRRTDDGRMRQFMSGTGLLAAGLDVAVVPVKLDGLFQLKREARYFARPGELTIRIGEPILYGRDTPASEITADLERRVAGLASSTEED